MQSIVGLVDAVLHGIYLSLHFVKGAFGFCYRSCLYLIKYAVLLLKHVMSLIFCEGADQHFQILKLFGILEPLSQLTEGFQLLFHAIYGLAEAINIDFVVV